MAGRLNPTTMPTEHRSSEWTKLVDRGGLYYVENVVYDLFVTLEFIVNEKLDTILNESGKGLKQIKKENLAWLYM